MESLFHLYPKCSSSATQGHTFTCVSHSPCFPASDSFPFFKVTLNPNSFPFALDDAMFVFPVSCVSPSFLSFLIQSTLLATTLWGGKSTLLFHLHHIPLFLSASIRLNITGLIPTQTSLTYWLTTSKLQKKKVTVELNF